MLVRRVGVHAAALDTVDALPEVSNAYMLALTAVDLRHRANLVGRVSAAVHRVVRRAKRIYGTGFDGPVPVMIPVLPPVETEPRDDVAA